MTGLRPEDLIDLARYPLHEAEGAGYLGLLRAAQGRLAEDGALVLPGFVTPAAVAAMVREAEALLPRAYYCAQDHNPYLVADDPDLPPAHPRNRPQTSDKGCIAHDLFAEDSALRALYDWPPLRAFIAAVQGVARLYPYEDPLASLNLNVFAPGQQLGWHFDNADFVTTLMLRPAEAGGVYEYAPGLRNPEDANYDAVARVLDGERAGVRVLDMDPGALVLFRGRYALHRVTPVEGTRPRLLAILSYDPEPGKMLTEHTRALFYGRVA
jgi:alkylated DNA repair dioxygenase AlkB